MTGARCHGAQKHILRSDALDFRSRSYAMLGPSHPYRAAVSVFKLRSILLVDRCNGAWLVHYAF